MPTNNINFQGFFPIAGFLILFIYLHTTKNELGNQISDFKISSSQNLELLSNNIEKLNKKESHQPVPPIVISKSQEKSESDVAETGFWRGLGAEKKHIFDRNLANALSNFLKDENVTTILELGCGMGDYSRVLMESGIHVSCYDGNPETQQLSDGRCATADFSKSMSFSQSDWVLSLEVGEHIPKKFENVFLDNLHKHNRRGIILSWAIVGQGGHSHINEQSNKDIRDKIEAKGYTSDLSVEETLRNVSTLQWFKNTIMVFRKL